MEGLRALSYKRMICFALLVRLAVVGGWERNRTPDCKCFACPRGALMVEPLVTFSDYLFSLAMLSRAKVQQQEP